MKNLMHQRYMFYGAKPHIFEKAKDLRENMTPEENVLWEKLRKNQLGVKFRRQHPIGNFIADFYCHQLKLVIEIDGGYHLDKNQKEHDKNRENKMLNYGITTIRFTNNEIQADISMVIDQIEKVMKEVNK